MQNPLMAVSAAVVALATAQPANLVGIALILGLMIGLVWVGRHK